MTVTRSFIKPRRFIYLIVCFGIIGLVVSNGIHCFIKTLNNVRVTVMALNILINTPTKSDKAKPRTKLVVK